MPLDSKQLKRIAIKKVYGPLSGIKTQITVLSITNAVRTMLALMTIFKDLGI